eukprot:4155362-Pyramimonas_sp.AAC.1
MGGINVVGRPFAPDGHSRPRDNSNIAQESPKRGPRQPRDGTNSAQERHMSGPRGDPGSSRGGKAN